MNIKDAFKKAVSGVGEQVKALPQYLSQQVTGRNPYDPGDISGLAAKQRREDQPFIDKGLTKTPEGSWTSQPATPTPTRVPMPPTGRPQVASASASGNTRGRNPKTTQITMRRDVYDAITQAADAYKVPRELMFDIAMAESTLEPTKTAGKLSSAVGLYMFTDGTWETVKNYANKVGSSLQLPNTNRWDPSASATAAAYLISKGQLGRWDASRIGENQNAWGKYWTNEELADYYAQTLDRKIAEE